MKKQFRILPFFLLFAFSLTASAAEKIMYKWTDTQGEVHYTERPPKDIEYTIIKSYADESPTPRATKQVESAPKAQEKNSYTTWRDENCTIATQNLDVLDNASRIGVDDGQGGTRLMTDEEKATKIKAMTEQRNKYCKPTETEKKK